MRNQFGPKISGLVGISDKPTSFLLSGAGRVVGSTDDGWPTRLQPKQTRFAFMLNIYLLFSFKCLVADNRVMSVWLASLKNSQNDPKRHPPHPSSQNRRQNDPTVSLQWAWGTESAESLESGESAESFGIFRFFQSFQILSEPFSVHPPAAVGDVKIIVAFFLSA